jgi:TonB family protein
MKRCRAIAFGLSLVAAGCASPPNADVEAARNAVGKAADQDANRYAAASLKSAQDAQAALDAELKTQDGKWLKSYDKAKELAVAAKAAGDRAAADAVSGKETADAIAVKAKAAAAAAKAKAAIAPLRIGGQIKPPTKVKDVKPTYPAIAQSARVQGVVIIEATIGPNGNVQEAKVLRSIPLLDAAALDAVRQWQFTPTLLNGVPVPVIMTVTVNFTLQ